MRDSLTGHHARIAQRHGRVYEAVEQADTFTEEDCGEINVELVEQSGVQALLDRVSAMDADRLVASRRFGLCDGSLHAIGDETHTRVGRPPVGNMMGDDEGGHSKGMLPTPGVGGITGTPPGEHRADLLL
jgi:hypothetical protein